MGRASATLWHRHGSRCSSSETARGRWRAGPLGTSKGRSHIYSASSVDSPSFRHESCSIPGRMRVRIVRKLADRVDGIDLTHYGVGEVIDLPETDGRLIVA